MSERYSSLMSPLRIRSKVLKSRFLYPTAQVHFLQGPETYPGDPVISYYEEYAKNGSGIIISQELASPTQRTQKGHDSKHFCQYDLYDTGSQNYFTQLAHFVHCQGTFLAVEMSNIELRLNYSCNDPSLPQQGGPGGPGGMPPMMPGMGGPGGPGGAGKNGKNPMETMMKMSDPEGPAPGTGGFPGSPNPRTIYLTKEKMQELFGIIADRCKLYKSFGYDAIMIDMGRDFLCGEFLSERSNRRDDEYNGSFENRMRFPVEYLAALRKALGDDFIIIINAPMIGAGGPFGGGLSDEEAITFIKAIEPYADIFRLHGSMNEAPDKCESAELSAKLKAMGAKINICINTPYMDLDKINAIIESGQADLIASARMFICNENLGKILRDGNGEDLNPCIECGICRGSSPVGDWMSHCTINPVLGMAHRAYRMSSPVEKLKKIAIIGGGPGGIKCALWLKERGHNPVIFEKSDSLGGQIKTARYPDFKWKLKRYLDFLEAQVDKNGIEVRLNTEATPQMIKAAGFDVVIAATGARPKKPAIEGAEYAKLDTVNVYENEAKIGKRVVVIGGNSSPAEAATFLALKGHDVTLLTRSTILGFDLNPINARGSCGRRALMAGVDVMLKAQATKIEPGKVTYIDENGAQQVIECDDVLAAGGMEPNSEAAMIFSSSANEFYMIGDCREAGSMRTAIRDAYALAIRV